MARYVAFLRALNVGGHTVRMEDLRRHFESLGLATVETFIASGNVIFEAKASAAALEDKIETHLKKMLGYEVAAFLRADSELRAIATHAAFAPAAIASAGALNVAFLHGQLSGEAQAK